MSGKTNLNLRGAAKGKIEAVRGSESAPENADAPIISPEPAAPASAPQAPPPTHPTDATTARILEATEAWSSKLNDELAAARRQSEADRAREQRELKAEIAMMMRVALREHLRGETADGGGVGDKKSVERNRESEQPAQQPGIALGADGRRSGSARVPLEPAGVGRLAEAVERTRVDDSVVGDYDIGPRVVKPLHREQTSDEEVKPKLHVKQFPQFSGCDQGGLDVDDWLFMVDNIWRVSGASERELLQMIPCLISDEAREWFATLGGQALIGKPWSEWQQAWTAAFRPSDYAERLHIDNARCHLEPGEPISDYWRRKYRLVQKRYGVEASDQMKISDIMMGLPSTLRLHVRTAMGSDKKTMTLEQFRLLLNEVGGVQWFDSDEELEPELAPIFDRSSQRHFERDEDQRVQGDSYKSVRNGSSSFKGGDQRHQRQYNPSIRSSWDHRTDATPSQRAGEQLSCWNCGGQGHVKAQCEWLETWKQDSETSPD